MGFQKRWSSPAFRRFFAIILIAEAVTVFVSFLLLNVGISSWIHQKTSKLVQISQAAAVSGGWSQVANIRKKVDSPAFETFRTKFSALEDRYFPGNNAGTLYLVILDQGEAYENYPDEPYPMQDIGKATKWELDAYATGKTTYNLVPYSDKSGTYLGAFTPVESNGKVVGLVAATYDTAPLTDFQGIVQTAFWLSLIPAVFLALGVAYILAGTFIEPMELFRQIEAAREPVREAGAEPADPLENLTGREREVADLVRQGLRNREIAERLCVSPETVKQHLKNIREKTGFARVELAVHAASYIRNLRIRLKHASVRRFRVKHYVVQLIFEALRFLGPSGVSGEAIKTIRTTITEGDRQALGSHIGDAPVWMQPHLRQITLADGGPSLTE